MLVDDLNERAQYIRLILPGGIVALTVPLLLHQFQPFMPLFDQRSLPVMAGRFLLLTAMSWFHVGLRWIEGAIIVLLTSYVLWRFGAVLFSPDLPGQIGLLASSLPWVIVALLIPSWVVQARASLIVNGFMVAGLTLLAAFGWPARPWSSEQALMANTPVELSLTVTTVIVAQMVTLGTHARRARQALQEAHTDVLTGLPNRRALLHTLEEHANGQAPDLLAVGLIDVDHFRRSDDQYGHATGEKSCADSPGPCAAISRSRPGVRSFAMAARNSC